MIAMSLKSIFWNIDWEFFSIPKTKNTDANTIFFLYFVNISNFDYEVFSWVF